MRKDNKRTIALYMFPAILMIVVLLYLPIFINLYESFFSWGAMSSSHKFVGIGNYMKMFKDEVFYTALKNNMIFMIMSVIFQIGLSLIIANTLESKFMRKTQNIFQSIYFIPSLLMVTVVGIAFKMICSPSIGIINPLLELIGINTENIDLLGNAGSATFSIAAMSQWQYIGYTVVLFVVAIQNIPADLYEAADIDGATRWKKMWYITLPSISSSIIVMLIISIGNIFSVDLDRILLMYNSSVYSTADVIQTYVYRIAFESPGFPDYSYGTAVNMLKSVIAFILVLAANKLATKYSETRLF